jgi:hypothetical protein
MLAEVFQATLCRSEKIMPPSDHKDKDSHHDRRICRSISRIDARSKGEKNRTDLSLYFGALKDSPLLDKIEEDSKRIREMAKPRS